ncbi:peptidylprolyl isomerase [Achlya hypogyna]|uniref:Peptidylprolyl isomerase n=1 Tax=Achlya hypogyna TaxID=1202772 RepID=A0A1V9YR90_ACHHY|nr:peptidylprolyl isomerase [Achlya hypogyna]
MGKNQHSKDRMFITASEHKYLYGGKKEEIRRAYRRLPFDCCSITLKPFENPVCSREGHLFDIEAVIPYVKEHNMNPVTGTPLAVKDLIKLRFHKNAQGEYFCPVTYKVFTNSTKIAAVATSGNVYAYEALEELNIKPKNWTDLVSGEAFKRKDIIVLQDPTDLSGREIENFEHFRKAKEAETKANPTPDAQSNIRVTSATSRILQEMEAAKQRKRQREEEIRRGEAERTAQEKIIAAVSHSTKPAAPTPADGASKLQYSKFTAGECSRSFTSTEMDPTTRNAPAVASEEEQLETRWTEVRKLKKKGYVRLTTTMGVLNLELDCDMVPRTCDNFLGLCEKGYYDNVEFHRIIRGFMMQGGDPTGTGRGGESVWGKAFRDEFDSRLRHTDRGVLSMANSGTNTNGSQFFITFKECTYLDNKHSVFGRVVGGVDVLDAIEGVATDKTDRPYDRIVIRAVQVFENPFKQYEEAVALGTTVLELKRKEEAPVVKGTVVKVGNEWVAYDGVVDIVHLPKMDAGAAPGSVGKYLPQLPVAPRKKAEEPPAPKKAKLPTKTTFANFDGW